MSADVTSPSPEELLERQIANDAEALGWLGEVWQFLLTTGLYLAGGPTDVANVLRMQLIERAQELAVKFDSEPLTAEANRITAHVLNAGERYKDAAEVYAKAIPQLEGIGQTENAVRTRLGYSAALMMSGSYDEALVACREAADWFEANGDQNGLAKVLINTGNIYHRMDEHGKALECQLKASEIFESLNAKQELATTAGNIANSYSFLDRFDESNEMYALAIELATECELASLADQARYNQSYLHFLRGRYSDALSSFNQLREHFRETSSIRHAALCDLDQSEIYLQLNMPKDAFLLARMARRTFAELSMAYEETKAIAFMGVAETQQHRYQEALEFFQQAAPKFVLENNGFWIGMVELYQAEVLLSLGRYWEAKFLGERALGRYESLGIAYQKGMALIVLGRTALQMDQLADAKNLSVTLLELVESKEVPLLEFPAYMLCALIEEQSGNAPEAYDRYESAAMAIEQQRSYLHHDELRVRFLDGKEAVYEALVELCLDDPEQGVKVAQGWCERAKARALADLLGQHLPSVRAGSHPELLTHIQQLREELNSQYVRARPDTSETVTAERSEIDAVEKELEQAFGQLSSLDVQFGALFGVTPADLSELQAILPDDTTVVEYFVSRGEVLAFVFDRDSLRVYRRLSAIEKVQQLAQGISFQMQKFALGDAYVETHGAQMQVATDMYLARLFESLVAPWASEVNSSRVIIIPHGELHGLPFHAFKVDEAYLCDQFYLSYCPSAEVLRHGLGVPTSSGTAGLVLGRADEYAPAIADELNRLQLMMPDSQTFSGEAATRAALFEHAESARFIHISTHSFFRKDNPMFSGFHLEDGPITALDLYAQHWPADLVTLSGCSSGVAEVAGGDDLMGLVRGFLHAGARSLMISQWNVSDSATVLLTEAFYKHWLDSNDKQYALTEAMKLVRARHPHPFYWAPFVLVGAP